MNFFKNAPIRIKLSILIAIPAFLALFIITACMSINEHLGRKYQSERSLLSMSKIISWNSTAALAFLDKKAAKETLQFLQTRPSTIGAFLYDKDNQAFTSYQTDDYTEQPQLLKKLQERYLLQHNQTIEKSFTKNFKNNIRDLLGYSIDTTINSKYQHVIFYDNQKNLHVLSPIFLDDDIIGSIHLVDNLDNLNIALKRFYIITGVTLLITLIMLTFVSGSLQRFFAEPLLGLMTAMNKVIDEKKFSSRVKKQHDDEFGQLAVVYNNMLSEIENRDQQLANYQLDLEQQVEQRTIELSQKNTALEASINMAIQAKEEAEAANKAKSQFLANMSHEIRTPMNAVLAMTEFLSNSQLNEQQTEFVDNIQHSSQHLLTVINDILDFSKIESNKLKLSIQAFDCQKLIQNSFYLLQRQAEAKGIDYQLEILYPLPDVVEGDDVRIKQILVNLLSNAVKFTTKGKVVLKVKAEKHSNTHWRFNFEVKDSGIGIEKEKMDLIFESFSQADESMTRTYGGTGLGLAIVKNLVQLMHGEIGVESLPDVGSKFYFQLDLKQSDNVTKQQNYKKCHFNASILVAEDYLANQIVIEHALELIGCTVKIACNGAEAVEQFMQHDFDLIFMDCQMPKLDGYQATRQIRMIENDQGKKQTPIIALTAHALADEKEKCVAAGMDEWITKPFAQHELNLALQKYLPKDLIVEMTEETEMVEKESVKKEIFINPLQKNVLDIQFLRNNFNLETPKGLAFITKLKGVFEETGKNKIKQFQQAFNEKNTDEISKLAHGFTSVSASIGGIKLAEQCRFLETAGCDQQLDQIEELIENIQQLFEQTMKELSDLIERISISAPK